MADAEKAENIYELLEIDPPIKLSATDAKQRIADALNTWNKQSGFPGHKGETARIKRDQWKRLSNELQYDAINDQQLEAKLEHHRLVRLNASKQADMELHARLADEIKFAALKGNILQREIDAWEDAYRKVAPRDTIEAMARPYRIKIQDDHKLSMDKLDEIDKSLKSLGIESLFSLVDCPLNASDIQVKNAAEVLYTKAAMQISADWTIKKALSGEAKVIFSSAVLAQQYRDHVRQQKFYHAYLEPIIVTCEATREITDSQVSYLLDRATKDQWKRDEAIEALFIIAYQRGWRVLPPSTGTSDNEQELLKAFKQQLAEAEQRTAQTQAENDKRERAFRESEKRFAATQAKTKIEMERLERELREAEKRAQAEVMAGQVKSDESRKREMEAKAEALRLRQQLAEWKRQEANNERQRIADVGPLLSEYMSRAELVAAQGIVMSFATLPPQWTTDAARIEQGIREAERLLADARRAMSQVERAETLVDAALAKCADFEPARVFKESLLPAAPSDLAVRRERGEIVLSWNPSPSQQVRYVIVRSVGAKPLSTRDGIRIMTVNECSWRDTDPLPARPLWYAVFAERNAMSSQLAVAETAVTILPDVSDAQVEVSDATVAITWRLPRGAHSIRIVRSETHAPQSINDGQVFALGQTFRYVDTGLVNGRQYFYRVYCEYTDLDGQIQRAEGMHASATPTPAPSTVPALTIRGVDGITNHTVYLDAPAPDQGSLIVFRSSEAPSVTSGMNVPAAQLKEVFGYDRREITGGQDTLFSPTACFYTPVILFQQRAYLGQPHAYLYVPAVHDLKAMDKGVDGIQLRWRWPSRKCDTAEVRYRLTTAASEATPTVLQVNRTDSDEGVGVLSNLPRGEYKISVLARYQFKGQIVFSSEEAAQVIHMAPVRVRYTLERSHGFMPRRPILVLTADQPVSLPDIRIVYGREPLTTPGDGRILCDFSPDSPLPASTWTVKLPDFPSEPDAQVRVFRKLATTEMDVIFEGE